VNTTIGEKESSLHDCPPSSGRKIPRKNAKSRLNSKVAAGELWRSWYNFDLITGDI
jgi:hypothetical protein